jgi:hypothetical protein
MWQSDSEMQTNDSYLRIARRLDSLRNRKGSTLNVMVAPPRKQATHGQVTVLQIAMIMSTTQCASISGHGGGTRGSVYRA